MVENDEKKLKIFAISDFNFLSSGYFNISKALFEELGNRGHEIKVAGLGYNGEEHDFPFSLISARDIREASAIMINLKNQWGFDFMVVAMDIPFHEQVLSMLTSNGINDIKYAGIMPVEADPLCLSWALVLSQMNKAFIISKFGTEEAKKVGIDATYLPIGIDSDSWRIPSSEERISLRNALGFAKDEFVVLTVAYNQERKFLSRSMEIFAGFASEVPNSKYVLVTAEHSPMGWRLRDYAQELGIQNKVVIIERGMPFKNLWGIYAASDAFLLTSKAEGLGMILMEAMAVGLPCIGTNCTGIRELLANGRGYLVDYDYIIRDPFGNGRRYYASIEDGIQTLLNVWNDQAYSSDTVIKTARQYIENRKWKIAADILENGLLEVINGKEESKETELSKEPESDAS